MPVYSMTGYASAQHEAAPGGPQARLGLEIRTVNSRFLDLSFRLPDEWRQHEPALRELLQSRLKRGKVELRASLESASADALSEPSPRLLQRLASLQDQVHAWLPSAPAIGVADALRLAAGSRGQAAPTAEAIMALATAALDQLLEARSREGARLAAMLQGHLAALRSLAAQAGPLVPKVVEQQRTRFLERWREAVDAAGAGAAAASPDAAQERALSEATAYAMRIDVAEELTRLGAHLDELERLVVKGGEIGKRLDFLIQELHREANTLGSKSSALDLTRISVDMKVLIEQMREQVQNIE